MRYERRRREALAISFIPDPSYLISHTSYLSRYFPSNSSTAAVIAVTPVLIVGSGTGR